MAKKSKKEKYLNFHGNVCFEWERRNDEIVMLSSGRSYGSMYFDLRIWFSRDGKSFSPTKRGIRLRANEVDKLRRVCREMRKSKKRDS